MAAITSFLMLAIGPILLSLLDFVTLARSRVKRYVTLEDCENINKNFSVLIPIFGSLKYLKNVEFLKHYGFRVILCTTTKESEEFNAGLEEISERYGFEIFRSHVPISSKGKPNPWKLFKNTLQSANDKMLSDTARDEIIRDSFAIVKTDYCIFLDGDTIVNDSLYKLVGKMEEENFDIASVRVLASKTDTLMEKLQSVEYELAMDARKIYPWLTSGAGMVAKTSVIKSIMAHHSLFFSGGDIEIGKLAMMLGYKVGHIACEFLTDVPQTFMAWVKQRMAWCGGSFRHCIVNLHSYSWKHPMFYLYTTIVVWMMTPIRWWEIIQRPLILPLVVVLYWFLIALFHWRTIKWYHLLFPIYSLFQVMVILPTGLIYYFKMFYNSQNMGFIRLRHGETLVPVFEDIGL